MLENEIPRKSAPAYSVKGKTRSHLEDVAVLGDGVKEIGHCSDPSRTNPAQGQQFSEFRSQQAMSTGRRCHILPRLPGFRRCISTREAIDATRSNGRVPFGIFCKKSGVFC